MTVSFQIVFGVTHPLALAERFGARVEIEALEFIGAAPCSWRIGEEPWRDGLHEGHPALRGFHDLQRPVAGGTKGLLVADTRLETSGIGDALVMLWLRDGTYTERKSPLQILQPSACTFGRMCPVRASLSLGIAEHSSQTNQLNFGTIQQGGYGFQRFSAGKLCAVLECDQRPVTLSPDGGDSVYVDESGGELEKNHGASLALPLLWLTKDGDEAGVQMYDRHYSARPLDGRELFVGPGEKVVLRTWWGDAYFAWRNFKDDSGQLGICCTFFRNESTHLSSELIRQADRIADCLWPHSRRYTFVDAKKVRSRNPGYCFLCAGWRRAGWTKGGLLILERPA